MWRGRPAPSPPPAGERAGVRGSTAQHPPDLRQHVLTLAQYLIVPEPHNPPPRGLQALAAMAIGSGLRRLGVLTTVEFDDQTLLDAGKVEDEPFGAVLTTELDAELVVAQALPQPAFRLAAVDTQAFAVVGHRPRPAAPRSAEAMLRQQR